LIQFHDDSPVMELGLENKVAAVAAASSGLGLAVAVELAREGARVAICSRDGARVEKAAASIRADAKVSRWPGVRVLAVAADLSSATGPATFLDAARSQLGPIDVLVVNNGGPPAGAPLAIDDSGWRAGFDLTFLSATRLVKGVADGMRERKWGRIIFITSVSVKQPIPDLAVSTAIRSAVSGYAKSLSDELAPQGITVNCVAPGSTLTERLETMLEGRAKARGVDPRRLREDEEARIPVRRYGKPEELAAAVAFLASERAAYITGVVLPVDGGIVRSIT
jgi:3-oxoacyl-[acyl-carrier protein] reductase